MKIKYLIWLIISWTSIIIASFIWNYSTIIRNNNKVVLNKSQSFFKQIVITRAWNAQHGGVYAPITTKTQPNPYLDDSLRDIVTVDGMQLTKINPAFMTRQIAEISNLTHDLQFHITSLNPIRPANKADHWETKALNSFEQGTHEILELINNDSGSIYKYMAPLITKESCLKCHAKQGYKYGDIRGGISVSFPAEVYTSMINQQLFAIGGIHLLVLILGIMGLLIYYKTTKDYFTIINSKNAALTETNATKDKLFSIIAHDLRTPFNSILGYTELLTTQYKNLSETQRQDFIKKIDSSSSNAFRLLENLLLWSRSQRGKIEIVKEDINLKKIINDAIGVYLPNAEKKSITCDINIPANLNIYADAFAIKTIIANLFNNAIKFTYTNGYIKIDARHKDQTIEISISDDGIGIPEEIIPKLFRIEENISTLGTNKEKGTGLGLLICKELIEKHNGKIWVKSEINVGSTFYLMLPVGLKKMKE